MTAVTLHRRDAAPVGSVRPEVVTDLLWLYATAQDRIEHIRVHVAPFRMIVVFFTVDNEYALRVNPPRPVDDTDAVGGSVARPLPPDDSSIIGDARLARARADREIRRKPRCGSSRSQCGQSSCRDSLSRAYFRHVPREGHGAVQQVRLTSDADAAYRAMLAEPPGASTIWPRIWG